MKVYRDPLLTISKHIIINNPGSDCYWVGGQPKLHAKVHFLSGYIPERSSVLKPKTSRKIRWMKLSMTSVKRNPNWLVWRNVLSFIPKHRCDDSVWSYLQRNMYIWESNSYPGLVWHSELTGHTPHWHDKGHPDSAAASPWKAKQYGVFIEVFEHFDVDGNGRLEVQGWLQTVREIVWGFKKQGEKDGEQVWFPRRVVFVSF